MSDPSVEPINPSSNGDSPLRRSGHSGCEGRAKRSFSCPHLGGPASGGRELVLASSSPRRKALLEEHGYAFVCVEPGAVETPPAPGEPAEGYAIRTARAKAEGVAASLRTERPGAVVLGADTVVECAGRLLGKPADRREARAILKTISGSRHAVVTGLVLIDLPTGRTTEGSERTELFMKRLSEEEIDGYVLTGEPLGKAGAYAIQESGDRYVKVLSGSLTNVVGLPMELLERLLCELAQDAARGARQGRASGGVRSQATGKDGT